jgi:lipoprotein-anchoring transpeptidase ErfK/SrfK
MRFRLGFLGAWALFVIAGGITGLAAAGVIANSRDAARLRRLETIDRLIASRLATQVERLRGRYEKREERVAKLRSRVEGVEVKLDDSQDTAQTIIVSTAENRVTVRRTGKTVFEAICSTGKGTTLVENGRTMVFETPTGRFRIQSKEQNPVWVPPDWHFVEEARKKNLGVARLNAGDAIDAETGEPVSEGSGGIWSLFRGKPKRRVLKVKQNTVVEVAPDGAERELPPGQIIRAGKSIVIPPVTVRQRRFEKVLGSYRLNIGGGYALHGTLATDQLGRSVSHGCVRLGDADMHALYDMAKVGDQVIIY